MGNGRVAVIGGGAAGMLAAAVAAENGATVTLFEKNEKLGRKLGITGKGRCNVTNHCDVQTVLANIPRNPRFLQSALYTFSPADTMALMERLGVELKTERGNRVFPVSDRASEIVHALRTYLTQTGVVVKHAPVQALRFAGQAESPRRICGLYAMGKAYDFDAVIVATGGVSYPLTGSTGDGYRFAASAGHTVISPAPSLVPLETKDAFCRQLTGLSLKNTGLRLYDMQCGGALVYEDFGELMFTHFGLTGPMILSASAHCTQRPLDRYEISLDLKPALDAQKLDERLLRDFAQNCNRNFEHALDALLPKRLIAVVIAKSGIAKETKVHDITRAQRQALLQQLKDFRISVKGFRPIAEAIITAGGVCVKEVTPKTMESKCCRGLFFAGEVLDVDAYTGGFNLQIAFSTAYAAGRGAAQACAEATAQKEEEVL